MSPVDLSGRSPSAVQRAEAAHIEEMAAVLTDAFHQDPVWGPAFSGHPDWRTAASDYWRFTVSEALRFPDSRVAVGRNGEIAGVAVWIPPGNSEFSAAAESRYDAFVCELLGQDAGTALIDAGHRFGDARPHEPHAYLTLLAVAASNRGGGVGMRLLRACLDDWDELGIPTYLESSNPVNDARYEALGYKRHGRVRLATGTEAATFWRDPAIRT